MTEGNAADHPGATEIDTEKVIDRVGRTQASNGRISDETMVGTGTTLGNVTAACNEATKTITGPGQDRGHDHDLPLRVAAHREDMKVIAETSATQMTAL